MSLESAGTRRFPWLAAKQGSADVIKNSTRITKTLHANFNTTCVHESYVQEASMFSKTVN